MTNNIEFPRVSTARDIDGTYICVSRSTPRFAVGARTKEEALAKASRALAFYDRCMANADVRTLDFEEESLVA